MSLAIRRFLVSILAWGCTSPGWADDVHRKQMQGLDEQVQEVKSDVLSIAAELGQLEEKLLYPSNTHVAVFVSLAQGESFRLDAVQVLIDGQPATHYIYTFKELEALQKGGVQRIYTGNLATGPHEIEVSLAGLLESGSEYSRTQRFPFDKGVGPKLIGVTLAGPDSGRPPIDVGDWQQ